MTNIQSISDEIVFLESSPGVTAVVEIDSTHILVADRFNARVGTIVNDSVTFGSDYTHIDMYFGINLLKIDSEHILVVGGSSNKGVAFIATIDGNTVTFGTTFEYQPAPNGTKYISAIMLDSTHFCVSFSAANTGYRGRSIIGTIDGSNLTFGNEYQFFYRYSNYISSCRLDDTHFCIVFRDEATAGDPECSVIGTVSNENEISFGGIYQFNDGNGTYHTSITALDSTHVFTFFYNTIGKCCIGTIDGNVIVWGEVEVCNSAASSEPKVVLVNSSTILLAFNDWSDGPKGTVKPGAVDGTTITWGDNITINEGKSEELALALVGDNKVITTYYDTDHDNYGTLVMITYSQVGGYIRPDNISGLYTTGSRGNLRGKASEGFIRPTIKQFFTSEDFEEIKSFTPTTMDLVRKPSEITIENGRIHPLYYNKAPRTVLNGVSEGKYYWEVTVHNNLSINIGIFSESGLATGDYPITAPGFIAPHSIGWYGATLVGHMDTQGSVSYFPSPQNGDIMAFALDCDNLTLKCFLNGVLTLGETYSVDPNQSYFPGFSSGANNGWGDVTVNLGDSDFIYDVPDGYHPGFGS